MKKILIATAFAFTTLTAITANASHVNPRINQTRVYNEEGQHIRSCSTDYDCCIKNPTMCEPGEPGYSALYGNVKSELEKESVGTDYYMQVMMPEVDENEDVDAKDLKENFCILNKNVTIPKGQLGQSVMNPQGQQRQQLLASLAKKTVAQGACDGEIEVNEVPVLVNSAEGKNNTSPATLCVLKSLDLELPLDSCKSAEVNVNK